MCHDAAQVQLWKSSQHHLMHSQRVSLNINIKVEGSSPFCPLLLISIPLFFLLVVYFPHQNQSCAVQVSMFCVHVGHVYAHVHARFSVGEGYTSS